MKPSSGIVFKWIEYKFYWGLIDLLNEVFFLIETKLIHRLFVKPVYQ
jgi:hypothetical protein